MSTTPISRSTRCGMAGVISALLLGPAALAACGGTEDRRPVAPIGASFDAGPDASEGGGGTGGRAGSTARGGRGAGGGQAGSADEDAGSDPNPLDPAEVCKLAEENSRLELPVTFGSPAGFALSTGVTGFGLAYESGACGSVGTLPIAASGMFAEPMQLFGDCARLQDIALLRVSDGWSLSWIDNASGSAELQTVLLTDQLGLGVDAQRERITNDVLREHAPIAASIGGTPYLAWISEDLDSQKRQVSRKRLDGDGDISTLLSFDLDRRPVRLAFAQMGRENAALAFVSEQSDRGIWLMALDKAANPAGEPVLLSDFVTAGNSVDLATREEDGGAVVYSLDVEGVSHEVRFRRLDKDGRLLGEEVKVVGSPLQGRDASIARLSGGYVVAYRQLPFTANEKPEIRVAFITKEGNLMRDNAGRLLNYPIAEADANGGRVTARVSVDGQLVVSFLNGNGDNNQLVAIRKRLDCRL